MEKKKAIKIAAATAIAASAFTAVAPTQSDAATSLKTQVSKAKATIKKPYDTYSQAKTLASTKTVQSQIDAAKAAKKSILKAINKSKYSKSVKASYTKQVNAYNKYITYADGYVKVVTYAQKAQGSLTAAIAQLKGLNPDTDYAAIQDQYNTLQTAITTAEKAIKDTVVGGNVEKLLFAKYTQAAKTALNGELKDLYAAAVDVAKAPYVKSVSAVDAKTVVVKFNKAIDASTIVDTKSTTDTKDDTIKTDSIKFTAIDGQSAVTSNSVLASLSADGKTLTLTAQTGEAFTKRFTVDIANTIKDTTGVALTKYSQILDTTDNTQPTVTGVSYEDNGLTLKVSFSEALASAGTVKLFDGTTDLSSYATPSFTAGKNYIKIPLGNTNIPVGKDLKLQIIGATDFNANALTPNPYETTVKKSTSDTTKPTVASVTVVNDKKVKVTFSEKLSGNPTITIGGNATTVTSDDTGTVYTATLGSALSGLQSVAVSSYSDLASNAGDAYSKVVELKADTTAPKLVSSEVKKIDGIEKLILTFDENVNPKNTVQVLGASDRYTNTDGINVAFGTTFTTNTASNFALYNAVDGESKSVALDITDLPKGTYTLNLPNGIVEDLASSANAYGEAKSITFVRTTNSLTTKPALDANTSGNGVTTIDNSTIEFTFTQAVDNSALNLANYNIDGISLASAVFYGNNKTVRVKLADNANAVSGTRTITVRNITNTSGIVMDNAITSEVINENVAPTFTASLTSPDVIKVVFSEPVANSTLSSALAAGNFAVKYDGSVKAVSGVYEDATTSTSVVGSKGYKTVYLKLSTPVADLTKTLTIDASAIKDVTVEGISAVQVGNAVSTATVTVSK